LFFSWFPQGLKLLLKKEMKQERGLLRPKAEAGSDVGEDDDTPEDNEFNDDAPRSASGGGGAASSSRKRAAPSDEPGSAGKKKAKAEAATAPKRVRGRTPAVASRPGAWRPVAET